MVSSRRLALVLGLSLAASAAHTLPAPGPACAQAAAGSSAGPAPKPAPKLRAVLKGDALAAFERAGKLFEDGDFAGARAEYDRAYALSTEPRLLYNVAACDKALRKYTRAVATLKKSLESRAQLPAEHVAIVEDTLKVLAPFVGSITIEGAPPGAVVRVDDEVVGTTPLAGPIPADVGERAVVVEKPGHVKQSARVQVAGDASARLSITLVPEKPPEPPPPADGRLRVQSDDATSRIFIDNTLRGSGTWAGALSPGTHSVRVERAGSKGYATTVEVRAGETRSLDVTLPEDNRVPTWVWVTGGVLAAAGAGVAIGFAAAPTQYRGSTVGTLPPRVVPAGFTFGGRRW